MPALLAAFIGGLVYAAASFLGRALIGIGVGVVTYKGFQTLLDFAMAQVKANFQGLSPVALQIAGLMQVDTCISMLMSAVAARLVVMGLQSGTMKKFKVK